MYQKALCILYLLLTGPYHASSRRADHRGATGTVTASEAQWVASSEHAGIFDDMELDILAPTGVVASLRNMTIQGVLEEVPNLEEQLTLIGGAMASQATELVEGFKTGMIDLLAESARTYLAPLVETGFWSRKGSYQREVADFAANYYATTYANIWEKTQFLIAKSLRYSRDNPGKTLAIAVGATVVAGGLYYLWRGRSPTSSTSLSNQSMSNALVVNAEASNLKFASEQLQYGVGALKKAASDPEAWFNDFNSLELQCIQRMVLAMLIQVFDTKLLSFTLVDIGGMSDDGIAEMCKEMPKDFQLVSCDANKLRNVLDKCRTADTGTLDVSKLEAVASDDAALMYPYLAPISIKYTLPSNPSYKIQAEISRADWNNVRGLLTQFTRLRQQLEKLSFETPIVKILSSRIG